MLELGAVGGLALFVLRRGGGEGASIQVAVIGMLLLILVLELEAGVVITRDGVGGVEALLVLCRGGGS